MRLGSMEWGCGWRPPSRIYPDQKWPIKDDSYQLSQLSLNLILDVARRVRERHGDDGGPWLSFRQDVTIGSDLTNQCACHPSIRSAVANYCATCRIVPAPITRMAQEHSTLYLVWCRLVVCCELPNVLHSASNDEEHNSKNRRGVEKYFSELVCEYSGKTEVV